MSRRPAALIALLAGCALTAGCGGAAGASGASGASGDSGASGASKSTSTPSRPRTSASSASKPKTYRGTDGLKTVGLESGGHQRTYLLYVPPGDATDHPLPLVLVFHGADDTAAHTAGETDLLSIAEHSHNMILVFAQGYEDTWNEGTGKTPAAQAHINDVAFTASILSRVESNYAIDLHRVVATGFSNGALLTEYLGCTLSRQLTMIAPVEGELPQAISGTCRPTDPVSVYEVHGTADSEIPYRGGPFTGVGGGTTVVLSASSSAARWATLDHCSGAAHNTHSGALILGSYGGCGDGVTVTLATINGGQHEWPPGWGPTLVNAIAALPATRTASP
jgi:polyhydroxybutyrate depolymerase